MPMLELEFEVFCSCGNGLCNQTTENTTSGWNRSQGITVEPCEKCLDSARDEGYEKGHEEGLEEEA